MSMNLRHVAALSLVVTLSSCAVQKGPTPEDVHYSEKQYEECMGTTDYPSECAYEKNVRDFWMNHIEFQAANSIAMPPPYLTAPNLSWGW
jgi:hypothetical protein